MENKIPILPYGSETILGIEGKTPNIMMKDATIALTAQEIPRVWDAVSQELWTNTKYI